MIRPLAAGMPRPIEDLARHFQRLPGVGEKTAQRFALAMATGALDIASGRAAALAALPGAVGSCARCGALAMRRRDEPVLCDVCRDTRRDATLLCVVARQVDLMAVERTGAMRGRYFVLGRLLSPLDGVGLRELPIERLRATVAEGVEEVLLALPGSVDGEATSLAVGRELAAMGARVTGLARGVSHGSDLEYADPVTMTRAIQGRGAVA